MRKYKVGDKLRIRERNDMVDEFGTFSDGDIKVCPVFTHAMKDLCGKDFTVSMSIEDRYYSEEGIEYYERSIPWSISAAMLEPRLQEEMYIATESELSELLYGGESV